MHRSVRLLLVAASVVPSSPILVILMKEALGSFETSVRRNIPEDTILHSHRRDNFKSLLLLLFEGGMAWTGFFCIRIGTDRGHYKQKINLRDP
jgi:hypothetical protein